jgi:hypothetical protein
LEADTNSVEDSYIIEVFEYENKRIKKLVALELIKKYVAASETSEVPNQYNLTDIDVKIDYYEFINNFDYFARKGFG